MHTWPDAGSGQTQVRHAGGKIAKNGSHAFRPDKILAPFPLPNSSDPNLTSDIIVRCMVESGRAPHDQGPSKTK